SQRGKPPFPTCKLLLLEQSTHNLRTLASILAQVRIRIRLLASTVQATIQSFRVFIGRPFPAHDQSALKLTVHKSKFSKIAGREGWFTPAQFRKRQRFRS